MIRNGREIRNDTPKHSPDYSGTRSAKLIAVFGALVFTVFLCLSVNGGTESQNVGNSFGEGAYQVFASADGTADTPKDTIAESDGSIWAYLESVIFRLIYGE